MIIPVHFIWNFDSWEWSSLSAIKEFLSHDKVVCFISILFTLEDSSSLIEEIRNVLNRYDMVQHNPAQTRGNDCILLPLPRATLSSMGSHNTTVSSVISSSSTVNTSRRRDMELQPSDEDFSDFFKPGDGKVCIKQTPCPKICNCFELALPCTYFGTYYLSEK